MMVERQEYGCRVLTIVSPDTRVCVDIVPELGGTVSSLKFDGRECLFQHPWFWDPEETETRGGIPLLFPICGRLLHDGTPGRYLAQGQAHHLPIHGFAMRLPWRVVGEPVLDSLRLRLTDTPATRAQYPFPFALEALYAATTRGLLIRLTVHNTGVVPLPFYAGFHPYFLTPPPGAGKKRTRLLARPRRRHLYNDTKTAVTGNAPLPAFPLAITAEEANSLLLEMADNRETALLFPDGFVVRQRTSPTLPFRQCYTLPDQPFFCDEPWQAPAGAMNQPGAARLLAPGATEACEVLITSDHSRAG